MNSIEEYKEKTFEDIKRIDDRGNEYWEARELQQILGYKEWRYFSAVIEKAQVDVHKAKIVLTPILV